MTDDDAMTGRHRSDATPWPRIAGAVLVSLALAACGGGNPIDNPPDASRYVAQKRRQSGPSAGPHAPGCSTAKNT